MKGDVKVEVDWVHIAYREQSSMREVYGFTGLQGLINLEGVRIRPNGQDSRTLLVYMHPASTLQLLPVPNAMAAAGVHVLCAASRYARNDAPLIMENVLNDLAAYMRHAREIWRYEKIVLAGWSGGGSLAVFYQSQAENPTLSRTAAGDPIDLSDLPPADGLIFHAAHLSRAEVLCDFIDPSVLDETNPDIRNTELDLYDLRNPNKPPYSEDYIRYFRAAQLSRIRRRTTFAKEVLEQLRRNKGKEKERALLTHCTLAEPRFLDGTLEPNDRKIGWCFLGDPESANYSPAGVARYSTARAWLSQWSIDDSQANAETNIRQVSVPLLAIENSADDAVPQLHIPRLYDAAASDDKSYAIIKGADHYYANQPKQLREVVQLTCRWMDERQLLT